MIKGNINYNITPAVKEVAELNLRGNIIDDAWFQFLKYDSGKANMNAIFILSEILYWYRPTVVKNEITGMVTKYKKKFRADKLQKNYEALGNKFGLSKRQVKAACDFLRDKNLITMEFRTIDVGESLRLSNVLFLEPIVENIKKISSMHILDIDDFDEDNTSETLPSYIEENTLLHSNVGGYDFECRTNTKTTTKTTTKKDIYNPSGEQVFISNLPRGNKGSENNLLEDNFSDIPLENSVPNFLGEDCKSNNLAKEISLEGNKYPQNFDQGFLGGENFKGDSRIADFLVSDSEVSEFLGLMPRKDCVKSKFKIEYVKVRQKYSRGELERGIERYKICKDLLGENFMHKPDNYFRDLIFESYLDMYWDVTYMETKRLSEIKKARQKIIDSSKNKRKVIKDTNPEFDNAFKNFGDVSV